MRISPSGTVFREDGHLRGLVQRRRRTVRVISFATYSFIVFALGIHAYRSGVVSKASGKRVLDELRKIWTPVVPQGGNCERLVIDINHEDWQKLSYWRSLALNNYTLHGIDHDYVSAQIRHKGKTIPVKVRLRGSTASEHLGGDRWSLGVRVRGDRAILGMKRFSLMDPQRRGFLREWVLREALRREGVISKRYAFVNVTINGRDKGVYAIDEHYDKTMLETSGRREGAMLRFLDDSLWAEKAAFQSDPVTWDDYYLSADIDAVGSLKGNEALVEAFEVARRRLEAFRAGDLPTHKVFDCEKMAKWMAVSDVLGAWHGAVVFNLRFYWNPITQLIEPIPDDGFTEEAVHPQYELEGYVLHLNDRYSGGAFLKRMFADVVYTEMYIRELERVSKRSYMENLLDHLEGDLKAYERILSAQDPYTFDKELLYRDQSAVRKVLNPHRGLVAHFKEQERNILVLSIAAVKGIPVEILGVTVGDEVEIRPKAGKTVIQAKEHGRPLQYQECAFTISEGVGPLQQNEKFNVTYRLLGASSVRSAPISSQLSYTKDLLSRHLIATEGSLDEFEFLNTDASNHTMRIKRGAWVVGTDLIIPGGYTVTFESGTTIDLVNGATLVSYSPVVFAGTEESPITVSSSDSTGQGLVVLKAKGESVLGHVVFDNLGALSREGWRLTGAVTFYESSVSISKCSFQNSRSEDALNIVLCEFRIKQSQFIDNRGDALDCDYAKGSIDHVVFLKSGNDAADFSGSTVGIRDCRFDGAEDKAISVGEVSKISADRCEVSNARIAVAAKDLSVLKVMDLRTFDCQFGIIAYQKKSEHGPCDVIGKHISFTRVKKHYLVETGSSVVIDGRRIGGGQKNVYSMLYGNE